MSQVLKSVSVAGAAGTLPHKLGVVSKPPSVVGKPASPGNHNNQASQPLGPPQAQSNTPTKSHNILSNPTPGMPGVLPGNILTGAAPKGVTIATSGSAMVTPSMGSGVSTAAVQQAVVVSASGQPLSPGTNINQVSPGGTIISDSENSSILANTKEKTPMCLVNELARFNKIQHQYTLTDEQGPAHKKVFYVKLKLGEEEYAADGPSIKKAQHAAADIALENTQYKHPPPKPPKNQLPGINDEVEMVNGNPSITPTVELNALAMKLGQLAIYRPLEPARNFYQPNLNYRGIYNQRYHHPRYPRIFYVSLKVGQREFIGEGNTRQTARHNAAAKALKVLSVLPITSEEIARNVEKHKERHGNGLAEEEDEDDPDDPLKSEISQVHEIALKRNMHVNFEVTKESGPPHMKTFVTRCTCGSLTTDGEGNSKKVSKKRAAEKMLQELQTLPTLNMPIIKAKKVPAKKKTNRNLIKKADPDYGVGINPISRLIQIQQAKKEKEPIYSLVAEKGMPRRKEFVMQVVVGEQSCNGIGPNKKLAKRNAAEAMLQQLGYSRPAPQPSKPAIKTGDTATSPGDKKVTFLEADIPTTTLHRQLVPGVLFMPESNRGGQISASNQSVYMQQQQQTGPGRVSYNANIVDPMSVKYSQQTTAAIAKELLDTGASPTAEAINKAPPVSQGAVSPKQQLLYLADVLGFEVQFTDFPKSGKKSDYLSLASLSTNPPQVSHGSGHTLEESHNRAAMTALKALSEKGLDSLTVADGKKDTDKLGAGDGLHVLSVKNEENVTESNNQ